MSPSSRDEFTIAIICALVEEANAVETIFDEIYDRLGVIYGKTAGDRNAYLNGRLGKHNVVVCYMPGMGKGSAAMVSSDLRFSYTRIEMALVVGICGGVPKMPNGQNIFLGDTIISDSVIEYDLGKQYPDGFRRKSDLKDTLGRPSHALRALLVGLSGDQTRIEFQSKMAMHAQEVQQVGSEWHRPTSDDILFESSYTHKHYKTSGADNCLCLSDDSSDAVCEDAIRADCVALGCEESKICRRRSQTDMGKASVHIGSIASVNTVMKSGIHRDKLAAAEGVIALEMEGAGVWDNFPCFIIKSVCDYADSHKDSKWQLYAAANGAAAAKTLLEYVNIDASDALQQTLEDHSSSVTAVAFSPDGKLVASGSDDKTVKLWDLATGTLQQTLEGHSSSVTAVAFSPDGKLVVSGSEDKTVKLWDSASGTLQQTLKSHHRLSRIAAEENWNTSLSDQLKLWYNEMAKAVITNSGPMDISAEDKAIMTQQLQDSTDMLSMLDTLVQWLIKLPDQEKNVKAILSMRIQLMKQFKSTGWVVNDEFTILPDYLKRSLAIIRNMFTSMITKLQSQQLQQEQKVSPPMPPSGGQPPLNASNLQQLEEEAKRARRTQNYSVRTVAFSPNSRLLASGSQDYTIKLWDPATGALQQTLEGHSHSVRAVAFSPDGRLLASGSQDYTIKLWDPATGTLQQTLEGHSHSVRAVAFSPDGRLLASGSQDYTIKLWDPATGILQQTLKGHSHSVRAVAFSPNSRLLASGSQDYTIKLWDPATGTLQQTLNGHFHSVRAVAFSPDGRVIASGSQDCTVKLWDPITGILQQSKAENSDKNNFRTYDDARSSTFIETGVFAESAYEPTAHEEYEYEWSVKADSTLQSAGNVRSELPTDSGYASAGQYKMEQEQDALESDDDRTVYSDASSVPAYERQSYISELAEDLFTKAFPDQLDARSMERVSEVLPELLRAFALRVGYKAPSQKHRDVMFFIHKNRNDIVGCFKDKCFHEDESLLGVQTDPEKMPLDDVMNLWIKNLEDCEDDSFSDNIPITGVEGNQDQNSDKDDVISHDTSIFTSNARDMMFQNSDAGVEEGEDEEAIMPRLLEYKGFIFKAPAYKWLLASIRREYLLTPSEPNVMERIRKTIITSLPSSHKISRKSYAAAYKMTFVVRWNPLAFVIEQEYKEEQDEAIGRAITLTGSVGDAQALTCAQYLSQTWPASGSHIIQLLKDVVRVGPDNRQTCKFLNLNYSNSDSNYMFQGNLPDNTEIAAWIHDSNFMVEVFGTGDSLAEVGEQFAWLGAALRSSPYELGVNHCTPLISDIHITKGLQQVPGMLSGSHIICKIDFTFEEREEQSVVANGQCWHNLFRNPVIVKGFPILKRPQASTGLEISLEMMIALAQARFVTTFDNKIFIKGFSTMLVPTEVEREMVAWHLLFNTGGSHISYTSLQVQKLPGFYPAEITMSGLETCRHVIGWCSSVKNHTGTENAAYHLIDWSGLENSQKGCDFEKLYISRGRLITRGIEAAIGRQDVPLRVGSDAYMNQLKWIAKKFVVLYDVEARRAWLVDGASALLHLVRTSLESNQNDEFKEDFIFKWDMIKQASFFKGSSAAISVLMNDTNKELKLYLSSNYRFKDRVEQICHTLEQVLTHQAQINLENVSGFALRHPNQKTLEGFDFMDIATEEDHFWARMTPVQTGGMGWTYFTRAIHAVTLFGNGFGELITPSDTASVCPSWTEVPKGQEYLVVCVSMIQEILRKKGNTRAHPWRIARDLYWYTPDKTFEECQCAGTSTRTSCDRAQLLFHKQQLRYKEKLLSSPSELNTDGAVIFGSNPEIALLLDDPNDPHEGKSSFRAEESGTRFIDSALGRSLNSSILENLVCDDTVKRRRESDLPESPFPSAKRLHPGHHSQQTSLHESPDTSNNDEFDASINKAGGLRNTTSKRGALSSLEIFTPKHESHTAKSRVHTTIQLCEKDYTVGWICALKTELDAAYKMLDENHAEGLGHGSDNNYYILGKIGDHNVVLTCLPMGRYGNDNAAIVATRMINKFPNITIGLMVGIGGGLPNAKDDIRLGDVVVSKPDSLNGGILQYDKGKCTIDGFKCTGFLNAPPERLLSVLQRMPPHGSVLQTCSSLLYPGEELDHLFKANYEHVGGNVCTSCDEYELVKRPPGNRKIGPCVFYGTIASGNAVIKDPATRDRLIKKHGALCFEMEAAGLLSSNFPCIVIRGVSDYADSHKNDGWQAYAAATAAQFAKDFIQATRSLDVMY